MTSSKSSPAPLAWALLSIDLHVQLAWTPFGDDNIIGHSVGLPLANDLQHFPGDLLQAHSERGETSGLNPAEEILHFPPRLTGEPCQKNEFMP